MAVTTRLLSTTRSSVPWRVGGAFWSRFAGLMRGLAQRADAAQLGSHRETEVGRWTGGRV